MEERSFLFEGKITIYFWMKIALLNSILSFNRFWIDSNTTQDTNTSKYSPKTFRRAISILNFAFKYDT